MTTTTTASTPPTTGRSATTGVTQVRVLLSEWTKIRSLRSTVYSLLIALVIILGLSFLIPLVTVNHWPPPDPGELASFDPTSRALAGGFLAQLAIGVLGVLLITGEYATGMIRATFAAVPARLPVLWAKIGVFGAVTLVTTLPTVFLAWWVGQRIFAGKHIQAHLSDAGVTRAIIGTALYLTVIGLLGLGIGALLRNTAAGISALFGVLFVLPIIIRFLPSSWSQPIDKYLPSTVGQAITQVHSDPGAVSPWPAFALFCGYAVVVIVAAAVLLRRRDA